MTQRASDRPPRRKRVRRGRAVTVLAKAACGLILAGAAFSMTGCHALYCVMVFNLALDSPEECSNDNLKHNPPPAQLIQSEPVDEATFPLTQAPFVAIGYPSRIVAGVPAELTATADFEASARPLQYRWEYQGLPDFNDHVGVGDAGARFSASFTPGPHTVMVLVTPASNPNAGSNQTASAVAVIQVLENSGGGAGTGPTGPGPEQPPAGNPLEIGIELHQASVPGQQNPDVRVIGSVSQDGSPVPGATATFDFESDGSAVTTATTSEGGNASAEHTYANGQHTVTVSATHGSESGTATRTFTYTDGQITGKVTAAGTVSRRPFSALLGLRTLRPGVLRRRGKSASNVGELGIGRLSGRLRRGKTPASLKPLLKSTWITKTTSTYDGRRKRIRVTGVAVATFATVPGRACIRYSASAGLGRRAATGRLSVVGGTDSAATMRAVASLKLGSRRRKLTLSGTLSSTTVAPRGLSPACQALLDEVGRLPG